MRTPVHTSLVVLAMASQLGLLDVGPVWAQQLRVLTLVATRREAPASILDDVINTALSKSFGERLDYYSEHMDVARFPDPEDRAAFRDFLQQKYEGFEFDLVIAPTDATLDLLRRYRDELFPEAAVVFSASSGTAAMPNATGLIHSIDMAGSIALALQLQPDLRQVYVVSGTSASDRYYEALARTQMRPWEDRLSIVSWSDLTFGETLTRASRLPSDAIIFAMPFTEDASGQHFVALASFQALAAAASVPIYHFSDLAMGHGAIGGALTSTDALARVLAGLAVRVLQGERPADIPVAPIDLVGYEVDWRQLERWGISDARVPRGTVVRFRTPGVWERYRGYVVGAVALMLSQTALIAGLLVQRRRRRRADAALRLSYQKNQDLVGRLITAQEAERTRIARDLHDDASQEVAGLAISMSLLQARVSSSAPDGAIAESLADLQLRTVTLGENLRTLSHELHPAVLQHAGIVAALRSLTREFERRQGIRARFEATEVFRDVGPEGALCLYRVAQEALANAGRHSGAGEVVVTLDRMHGCIQLSVVDNGAGFDIDHHERRGLGLRSIDERVRLLGGISRVTSTPGRGTTIVARLPGSGVMKPAPGRTA